MLPTTYTCIICISEAILEVAFTIAYCFDVDLGSWSELWTSSLRRITNQHINSFDLSTHINTYKYIRTNIVQDPLQFSLSRS